MKDGGLGARHPSVIAAAGQVENLKRDLGNAVTGLKRTLDTKVEIAEGGLKSLKDAGPEREQTLELKTSYIAAKQAYDEQSAALTTLREKALKLRVEREMPTAPVQIHAAAQPGQHALSPEAPILLAAGGGLGCLLGFILAFLLEKRHTSRNSVNL
jgi:uncharacterized protein involved in exopolysaccharide biosynthesis